MSQSDYLRRKRVVTVLKNDSAENPVYNSRQLLDFKQYQVENSVVSNNITYKRMLASGEQNIFGMERDVSNCPSFECKNTSQRTNRVLHTGRMYDDHTLNWHEKNALNNAREPWCKCELNRSTTDDNACLCYNALNIN